MLKRSRFVTGVVVLNMLVARKRLMQRLMQRLMRRVGNSGIRRSVVDYDRRSWRDSPAGGAVDYIRFDGEFPSAEQPVIIKRLPLERNVKPLIIRIQ